MYINTFIFFKPCNQLFNCKINIYMYVFSLFLEHTKFTNSILIFNLGLILGVTSLKSGNGTEHCDHPWKQDFGLHINDSTEYVFLIQWLILVKWFLDLALFTLLKNINASSMKLKLHVQICNQKRVKMILALCHLQETCKTPKGTHIQTSVNF